MNPEERRLYGELALDWKARGITKPRGVLTIEHTARTLHFIRRMACVSASAPKCGYMHPDYLRGESPPNPCEHCARPGITVEDFSAALFGIKSRRKGQEKHEGDLIEDEARIRRWLNGRAPMQPHTMKQAMANAYVRGWLTPAQAVSMFYSLIARETTSSVLRRYLKRIRDRVTFRQTGAINEDPVIALTEEWQTEFDMKIPSAARGRQKI